MVLRQAGPVLRGEFPGRQHQHRDGCGCRHGPELLQDLEPVHLRHHQIQDDEVRPGLGEGRQGLGAAWGRLDRVPLFLQDGADMQDRHRIVLHHQDEGRLPPGRRRRRLRLERRGVGRRPGNRRGVGGLLGFRAGFRQGKGKGAAPAHQAFHRDLPAQDFGQGPANGQPQAGAFEAAGGGAVRLPELVKDIGQDLRGDAHAGIPDDKAHPVCPPPPPRVRSPPGR